MATEEDVRKAWAAWDAKKPMTPDQLVLLRNDEHGNRTMPNGVEKTVGVSPERLAEGVAQIIRNETGKLQRRIEALEAEIRAGHERLKTLEGRKDDRG